MYNAVMFRGTKDAQVLYLIFLITKHLKSIYYSWDSFQLNRDGAAN